VIHTGESRHLVSSLSTPWAFMIDIISVVLFLLWCRSELWVVNDHLSWNLMIPMRPSTACALAILKCQPFLCTLRNPKQCGQFWLRPPFFVRKNLLVPKLVGPIVWNLVWISLICYDIQRMSLRVRHVHWLRDACLQGIPVVPHKAVAEVSE